MKTNTVTCGVCGEDVDKMNEDYAAVRVRQHGYDKEAESAGSYILHADCASSIFEGWNRV